MEDKYSPSPGDKDLIKRCEAMFDMAKKSRQDTENVWRESCIWVTIGRVSKCQNIKTK